MQRVMSVLLLLGLGMIPGCAERQAKSERTAQGKAAQVNSANAESQANSERGANSQSSADAASQSDAASPKVESRDTASAREAAPNDDASAKDDTTADDTSTIPSAASPDGATVEVAAVEVATSEATAAAATESSNLPPPQLNLEVTGNMTPAEAQKIANAKNRAGDWNQWGGSTLRNNVVEAAAPIEWDVGEFDSDTGAWTKGSGQNLRWVAALGSQTYGNVVAANGKVLIGTNNGAGHLKRYPAEVDLGVLVCFDEKDGSLLWQDSSEKLPTGRVNDWPLLGVCSSALVEENRVYYVSNRGELRCLDLEGFRDGKNDGSVTDEKQRAQKNTPDGEWEEQKEADVVWVLDMMSELGVSQHNMASSSVTVSGDYLFVLTGNGVDVDHEGLPAPNAASFLAVDKRNGKMLWSDGTPGINVLHGQWSSPAYAVIDGEPQVIFAGGDGWLYSFDPRGEEGKSKLLWKFDCNPKESLYKLTGATRNILIATPVIYQNHVYIAVGEDPEHGEGTGHLWCIDPTKRGDVSPELVFNSKDPEKPVAPKRMQAMVKEEGDFARANPNSAAVWHYSTVDKNKDGKLIFEETMHRTMGTVAVHNDLLIVADFSGLVHCVDAKTGEQYWTHDMLAASWGSPLIAGEHVYISDEDGEVTILKLAKEPEEVAVINLGNSVYSTPIVANGVLYISNKSNLFAIGDNKSAQ